MTRSLRPLSLLRGLYYYVASALAAFYLVFVHSVARQVRRTVRWGSRSLGLSGREATEEQKDQRKKQHEERKRQRVQERAAAQLNLPLYKHACDCAPSVASSESPSPSSSPAPEGSAPWSIADCPRSRRVLTTRDGVRLTYYVLFPGNPRLMVFASGLGFASDFAAFASLVHRYGKVGGDFSFIAWDYRGLFSSGGGPMADEDDQEDSDNGTRRRSTRAKQQAKTKRPVPRRLAIPNHAEDLADILAAEGRYPQIDLLVGYSLGVAISLEFAALYPDRLKKLALINGTYGSVFETAFQPFFRVPFLSALLSAGIEFVLDHPVVLPHIITLLRPVLWCWKRLYNFLLEKDYNVAVLGPNYLEHFLSQYLDDTVCSPAHTDAYLRLFQELNAHSAYHLLRYIQAPTLVISGLLDVLTPAYCGFEMARRLPNSRHVVAYLSSHCVLLEQPVLVAREIARLLEHDDEQADTQQNNKSDNDDEQLQRSVSPFTRAAEVSASAARRSNGATTTGSGRRFLGDELNQNGGGTRIRSGSDRDGPEPLVPEHSQARRTSAYYPHDSDDDEAVFLQDDHTSLRFEDDKDEEEEEERVSTSSGQQAVAEIHVGQTVAAADDTVPAAASSAAVAAPLPAVVLSSASSVTADAPVSYASLVSGLAHFDPSLPVPPFPLRPVAVLTCADQGERKHDDRALIASLQAAGVPAEHVVWDSPGRPWAHYRAVVIRSPWGYWRRPKLWNATIEAIQTAGVPCGNSVDILRFNSHKVYLKGMEERHKAHTAQQRKEEKKASSKKSKNKGNDAQEAQQVEAEAASSSSSSVEPMGFIPTLWLHQSDLSDAASISSSMVARGWGSNGGVLKPTSSAGGANTIRLPSPLQRPEEFANAVAEAQKLQLGEEERKEAEAKGEEAEALPTWMLQPFQPQILTDGEFSFFFLLSPGGPDVGVISAAPASADIAASASASSSSSVSTSAPRLRFIHGGQKRPKSGSFLVQPTQGGILTPWTPTAAQIETARATIGLLTPFAPEHFLYVRVDCIRAWDSAADAPASDGRLLLMELEAIEPDFYSHLTPDFASLYFDAARTFLQREGVWDNNKEDHTGGSGSEAASAQAQAQQLAQEKATTTVEDKSAAVVDERAVEAPTLAAADPAPPAAAAAAPPPAAGAAAAGSARKGKKKFVK
jgi:pimeloyl-ACP methyl ester carboxylesterase